MIAEEPGDFAEKLIELYQSEELWQRISRNALLKTKELFSRETARRQLEQLLNDDHFNNLSPSPALASTLRKQAASEPIMS
jgi:glycosyltransferase involved in cell wall biosynthesis